MITAKSRDKKEKYFESQDPDESVILIVRKHPFVLASPFLAGFMIVIAVLLLYLVLVSLNFLNLDSFRIIVELIIFLIIIYTLLYSFKGWLIKYLDILVLTSKHLVVIRQDGLFKRSVSVLDLSTIQDVAVKQHGILQTLIGFGKINVQTAGEAPNFVYSGVGSPGNIQDAVMGAKDSFTKKNHGLKSL